MLNKKGVEMNISNNTELSEIARELLNLSEYKRKQLALILIGSTLTDISRKEAETITNAASKEESA
tara:strand:+ start:240 stop:437 length:198 start_codon:yes stop_codon:yes gene_type:complete